MKSGLGTKVVGLALAAFVIAGAVALGFKISRSVQAGLDKQNAVTTALTANLDGTATGNGR